MDPLTDEQIWTRPYPYGNTIGHLLLHLTGNLSYYIAGEIGGSGYVRNRPLEFTDTSRAPKAVLLKMFDGTIEMVVADVYRNSLSKIGQPRTRPKALKTAATASPPSCAAPRIFPTTRDRSSIYARNWNDRAANKLLAAKRVGAY